MPQMTGPLVAMMDKAQMATSQRHPLRPQSEPPRQGPPGAVILRQRLGQHTVSIGRTFANQSLILLVLKVVFLVQTWALIF